MPDDYPPGWTSWIAHDEPPGKPEVPPVHSLRSGAHADSGDRYTTQPYPQGWRHPISEATARAAPSTRSPIDEAMAAAACHVVVPEQEQ